MGTYGPEPEVGDALRQRWHNAASLLLRSTWFDRLYFTVFAVSPTFPPALWRTLRQPDLVRGLWAGWWLTVMFTFGMTMALSAISGTLWWDADPVRLQFAEDKVNLILYILVCPSYVALSAAMVGVSVRYWAMTQSDDSAPKAAINIRGVAAIFIVLMGASISIAQYQFDILTSDKLAKQYWFLSELNGVRVLNRAGFYYIIMNFALLCVVAFSGLAYCALIVRGIRDARALPAAPIAGYPAVLAQYEAVLTAVAIARLLTVCYLVNALLWDASWLGDATQDNLVLTALVLAVVGIAGTRVPASYIQRKLDDYRARSAAAGMAEAQRGPTLQLPRMLRWLAGLSDVILGAGLFAVMFPVLDVGARIGAMVNWIAR